MKVATPVLPPKNASAKGQGKAPAGIVSLASSFFLEKGLEKPRRRQLALVQEKPSSRQLTFRARC
jgi:hypothetical protein